MLDFTRLPEGLLDPIARVVYAARRQAPDLAADRVMLVGAGCRDVLHAALGHKFETRATRDLDLALALSEWETFEALAAAFPAAGDTGIRFAIAGQIVDLLPFGNVEDAEGLVAPPTRAEAMSVWAFAEIHRESLPLVLDTTLTIRMPTVPGYTAAKLAAWLDRSEWQEAQDANDLALAAYWYSESHRVIDRLYSSEAEQTLIAEEMDVVRAAAHLLGQDVSATIGTVRRRELLERWPGDLDMLVRNFTAGTIPAWPMDDRRRRAVVDSLTRGLTEPG